MLRSLFQTRLSSLVPVGEEEKQIKANFLLPIVVGMLLFDVFAIVVTVISREYILLAAFIISSILLFIAFDLLRNRNWKVSAILFMLQGYGLSTASLFFEGKYQLAVILFIILYLIIAGILFNPKVFLLLFIYGAGLIFMVMSETITPLFSLLNLPIWVHPVSLGVAVVLIAMVAFVGYRAIMQSLQISVDANEKFDQLEGDKQKYEFVAGKSSQAIFITDLEGKIEYVNPQFSELMGYASEEVIGENPRLFKTEFTPPEFYDYLWKTITEGEEWIGEFVNQRKDGGVIYVSAKIVPLVDANGEISHYVAYENDITKQKELAYESEEKDKQLEEQVAQIKQVEAQIKEQNLRDRLTDLYNRVHLNELLPREALRSIRARNHLILLMVDVDHFRAINERYSQSIGDCVLQEIAKWITASIGTYDLVFRYDGDQFVILFSGKVNDFGEERGEQLRDDFANHTLVCDGQEISLTMSMGVVVYPAHTKKEEDLLLYAEKALAVSKQSGGNRVTIWSEDM